MARRTLASVLIAICVLLISVAIATAQGPDTQQAKALAGSAFTYQGRLEDGSGPITGTCNFTFRLLDAGSSEIAADTASNTQVTNGYFRAELDFGAGAFDGNERSLEINADCGDGTKTFGPQPLTPAPYALALPGLWTDTSATVPNIVGGFSGNVVDTGVSGATIGGGGDSGAVNRVADHYGTVGGGSDNLAGSDDSTQDNARWATVGGGQDNAAQADGATVGGGTFNRALGYRALVAGGSSNYASAQYATVGGGYSNSAADNRATVGGGDDNTASGPYSTIAGGRTNVADAYHATVGGGVGNEATGAEATVAGGDGSIASGTSATVPGGEHNEARGNYSFAAGYNAIADHKGAFVWADATTKNTFVSTADHQFLVRAAGGAGIGTNSPQAQLHVSATNGSGIYASGTGISDKDLVLGTTDVDDDGTVWTDPAEDGSDLFMYSNDEIWLYLDNNNDEDGSFQIRNGVGSVVWSVDEGGNVTNSGVRATAVETQDGSTAQVYAVQSPEQWFEDFGTATIKNGSGAVTIAKDFAQTVNLTSDYHVYLTPLGDCPLYVSGKTSTSFTVQAQSHASCSIDFDYRIVAKRQEYETARMETVALEGGGEEQQ